MARARNLKPGFFLNEDLVELPFEVRLLFAGLWTIADRDGRLEDRPAKIKMAVFPADSVDVNDGLSLLAGRGLVMRYSVGSGRFVQITNFKKHQNPHVKEVASTIPAPDENDASTEQDSDDELSDDSGKSDETPVNTEAPDKHRASTVQAVPLTSSLNPDSLSSLCVSPERVSEPAGLSEYTDDILTEIRGRHGLLQLRDEALWCDAVEWAFTNGFAPAQFLECHALLSRQKWRTGRVTGKNVADNLPELDRVRKEIQEQENGNGKKTNGSGGDIPERTGQAGDRLRSNAKLVI